MRARSNGLWADADFRRLWGSDTVALVGLNATQLALPLTAVGLGAGAREVGLLTALQTLPALVLGLLVGAWVDRRRRRPLLVGANLARAALLGAVPLAAHLGLLGLPLLYLVAGLGGAAGLVFVVAYQAYMPGVVPRERLVAGNGALRASEAAAQLVGPALGGLLVPLLGAATTVGAGGLAALAAALALRTLRTAEPSPAPDAAATPVGRAIVDGLRHVRGDPTLRPLLLGTTAGAVCANVPTGIFLVYAARDLVIPAGALGLVVGAAGPTALVGALLAGRVARRAGPGMTLVGAATLRAAACLLLPLAGGPLPVALATLLGWRALAGLAEAVGGVTSLALVQAATPPALRGRVNAIVRVGGWGAIAAGSLLGGVAGEALGLRPALALAAAGMLVAAGWLARSPVRALRADDQQ